MTRAIYAVLLLVLGISVGAPLRAHHSFAAHYDMQKAITIQGSLVEVRLSNPHSWFYLSVKEADGTTSRWSFEAGTPSGMIRNGYSPQVIKEGDEVTISGFPARDESKKSGMLRQLVTADGQVYGMFGPREGAGAR